MNKERDRSRKTGRAAGGASAKCDASGRPAQDLTSGDWEEFVIRYDREAGRYVTRTACCPGAPVCC